MQTSIITRAIYKGTGDKYQGKKESDWQEGGILTVERLRLMEDNFIESLLSQIDKDFRVYVIIGEEDAFRCSPWGKLDVEFIDSEGKGFRWATENKIPRSDIEVRMDTDDRVVPGWVSHIKQTAENSDGNDLVISYRPFLEDENGILSYHKIYYNKSLISNFLALVQKGEKKHHVYQKDHNMMGRYGKVIRVREGYCFLRVHGSNRSSHKHTRKLTLEDN